MPIDQRFQRYAGRVARLRVAEGVVGTLFLDMQEWEFATGKWWSRTRNRETCLLWRVYISNGSFGLDEGLYRESSEAQELEHDRFAYKGQIYELDWLSAEAAMVARAEMQI